MHPLLFQLVMGTIFFAVLVALYTVAWSTSAAHRLNRFLLLIFPLFSFLLPFVSASLFSSPALVDRSVINLAPYFVTPGAPTEVLLNKSAFSVYILCLILWGAVAFLMLLTVLFSLLKIYRRIKFDKGEQQENFVVHITDKNVAPWSFFKHVFVPKGLDDHQKEMILLHETTHVHQLHSIDVVFAAVTKCLLWWHPMVYVWERKVKENHEFLADKAVLNHYSKKQYASVLLGQLFYTKPFSLSHPFISKFSTLKNRIKMMNLNSKKRKYASVLSVGVCFVTFFTFATQQHKAESSYLKTKTTLMTQKDSVYNSVEKMPEFPGGQQKLIAYLQKNITYPEQALADSIQGVIFVEFTVTKKGKITDVKPKRKGNPILVQEALRVVSAMPDWNPGEENGKKVNVRCLIPIRFRLN